MKSISVMLTTVGRPELLNMLESLINELQEQDYLYIFVDGKNNEDRSKKIFYSVKEKFKCNIICSVEQEVQGHWGHGLRNKYQNKLLGDYIIHADDDDIFLKNSFTEIRNIINNDINQESIYFFKFYDNFKLKKVVWRSPVLSFGNIGTPCGVIPNKPENFGFWEYRHGGDFDFYNSCKFKNNVFIDKIIYCVKPFDRGYYE